MKNSKTYKQFKNWVKATCTNDITNKMINSDIAHAIHSAYYIFKHNLKDSSIDDFIAKDCQLSFKHFHDHGIHLEYHWNHLENNLHLLNIFNNNDIWKKYNPAWSPYYYVSGNFSDFSFYVPYWKSIVMSIYDYWNNNYELEQKFFNSKSVLKNIKQFNSFKDYYNLLWYCVKHNLSENTAYEWLKAEIDKRHKIFYQDNHLEIDLCQIDAYSFKDIFNVSNENFKIFENTFKISKLIKHTDKYIYHDWQPISPKEVTLTEYKSIYGYIMGINLLKILKTNNVSMINAFKYLDNAKNELVINNRKECSYSECCHNVKECITKDGEIYNVRNKDTVSNIEPITLFFHSYLKGNSLEDIKERYLNMVMFLYMMLKTLDDPSFIHSNISYEEFSKPIYKNEQ